MRVKTAIEAGLGQEQAGAARVPLQSANVPAGAFGAPIARGIGDVAQATAAIEQNMLKLKAEDDEREAKQLDIEFSQAMRKLTFGDDETEGYYASAGQNAIDGYKSTRDAIDEMRKQFMGRGSNQRVQRLFGDVSARRVDRENETMARHVATERKAAANLVSEARLAEAADDAGAHYNNPKVIDQSIGVIRSEVDDLAKRNGWAPEVKQHKLEQATSGLHVKVINAMMVSDPGGAKDYFEKHVDEIDGSLHAGLEKQLKDGVTREAAQGITDRLVASGGSLQDQLAEARKIQDGALRDEVVKRVKLRFDEGEAIRRAGEREMKQEAWQVVEQTGSTDNLTPQQRAILDGNTLSAMERRARAIKTGEEPVTDWSLYDNLMTMTPEQLMAEDMNDHRNDLSDTEFRQVVQRRSAYFQAKQKGDTALGDEGTITQQINTALDEMGYSGSKHAETRGKFRRLALEWVNAEQQRLGKKLGFAERQQVLNRLMANGEIVGTLWNTDSRLFEVMETDDLEAFAVVDIDDVPGPDRAAIERVLKAAGREVTDDAITSLYNMKLMQGLK